VKKIIIAAAALSMLAGGPTLAKSVKVVSVAVAKGGNSAYASSSASASVSSNGSTSYNATATFTGSSGKAFVLAKPSNGPVDRDRCNTSGCTASIP
jgi:hypothetical protein